MQLTKILAVAGLTAAVVCTPAWSQEGRPNRERSMRQRQAQQLPPEKAEEAWAWQAKDVARSLDLDESKSKMLVKEYMASRKALAESVKEAREAARAAREAGGDVAGEGRGGRQGRPGGAGGRGMMRETMETERSLLSETVSSFLDAEQTKTAMASLGSFNGQWDRMVDTVLGFELDESKTYAALDPIRTYMASMTKARESGDRESMRTVMRGARETMDQDLAKVLSEEQLTALQPRRGRGGAGGGEGRGQRGARGGDEPLATKAKVGELAPAFTLADSGGTTHQLSDYAGKVVVLQWINPDCPVCRRVSSTGLVNKMKKQVAQIDPNVVHLTVNSTSYMEPDVGAAYLAKHDVDAPVLIDRDGTVGHLYGAKTTPHLFVIDAEGTLRYQGAFDDDPRGSKGDGATNYGVLAVRQIAAGETVAPDSTKPYGCSVKYAKK